ncbi:acyloxyacyl hydrolase [Neorhizobium sp. CSC1952]|uniref:acyloxyacyl hydrolase n=1 Tax=Neorhizobium TaxID=1525371 RepID=UPI0025A6771B|nr:acyloxyacyl hydrolase [Rhizobium sp. CSC1952]WJR66683.1 acyloxyacyl hydrolase [Rhizobium sp. CSC1952]
MLMKSRCRRVFLSSALTAALFSATFNSATAQEPIFDEARFGVLASIDDGHHEDGVFATGMLFFDPWSHDEAQGIDKLLRPRIHVGGSLSTADETSQVYAGLSWTADLTDRLFLEVGVGGAIHDGDLDDDGGSGPALGCRLLFHEYAAAGFKLTDNWRIAAQVEHSSHAELCDGPNDGLSHAGVMLGYKF